MSSPFRSFVTLCAVGFLAFLSYDMIRAPVLPLFAEHLGASPGLVGFIVAASTLTGVCLKLPAGVLSDRLGRRTLMWAGVTVFAVAPFGYFFVTQVWQLILLRFLHGMATAIFTPVALAVVADLFPAQRGETIGWYSALRQSGTLLGRTAGGALIDASGFTAVFAVCGAIGLVILGVFGMSPAGMARATVREEPISWPRLREGLIEILRHPRIIASSLMQGLQMMADGALMAFLPLYGLTVGLTATQVGVLFGLQGVVSILTRPMMGRLSDRMGRPPLIIGGLVACAAAFALLPAATTFWVMCAPAAFFGFGGAVVASSTSAYVADLSGGRTMGAAMGVFGMWMDIGHASGPLAAGLLVAAFGYRPAFVAIAGALLVGLALFAVLERVKISDG
ncbi:MAG TPA: MFS transporter [Nitrospiria bacterium]|nr:MFS transporter [Nitrospiria bacterium]